MPVHSGGSVISNRAAADDDADDDEDAPLVCSRLAFITMPPCGIPSRPATPDIVCACSVAQTVCQQGTRAVLSNRMVNTRQQEKVHRQAGVQSYCTER